MPVVKFRLPRSSQINIQTNDNLASEYSNNGEGSFKERISDLPLPMQVVTTNNHGRNDDRRLTLDNSTQELNEFIQMETVCC